jgi:enoyl-CoA hydratase/carnithine racemase
MTSNNRIVTETKGHVYLIGLDREEKLNAFDRQMLRELAEAFTEYEETESLWCAVIYPIGDNFTAGLDLADVGPSVAEGEKLVPEGLVDPFGLFGRVRSKPLVHAARGWCLTVGTELALASDIRLAAPDTKFGQIEVKRGIMPFGGATLRLPQVAGWGNAMRYLLTGDTFSGDEAHRIGLVQELAESDAVVDEAIALAERIASQAPLAVQESLQSARTAIEHDHPTAVHGLMDVTRRLMATDDAKEGMQSFVERREAEFEGK